MTQTVNPGRSSTPRLRRLTDRILVWNPGPQRLRAATRVTLAVVAAVLFSYLLVVVVAGGFSLSPLFGAVSALLATNAVQDNSVKERKVTTLILFFPALGRWRSPA